MSTKQKIWSDGEALTVSEFMRDCAIGAQADDAALASLFTPGAVQKRILPLSEETASVNPRLLAIPSPTNGAIRVQPALFIAGGSGLPNNIALSARQESALDSALIGSNSSGSTRYDLVYATARFVTTVNAGRQQKSVYSGTVSTQTLPLEVAPQVTLSVLPNVGNVTPTATMPADTTDGTITPYPPPFPVYYFPIALITVANGYTSGTAHAQSAITPLWSGGWIAPQRVRGEAPLSIYFGAASEKPSSNITSMRQGAERIGSDVRRFGHFKLLTSTPVLGNLGALLDNSIDWRYRWIRIWIGYIGPATMLPLEGQATQVALNSPPSAGNPSTQYTALWSGAGLNTSAAGMNYNGASVFFNVYSDGSLRISRSAAGVPIDGTNGDLIIVHIEASDQWLLGN